MAAASPVVINSSSPHSIRPPSITPPTHDQSSRKLTSSSPQLPSPSTFVRPRAPPLKSGSRAQDVPDGVQVGFTSVRSLWATHQLENERNDNGQEESPVVEQPVKKRKAKKAKVEEDGDEKGAVKGAGKLAKAKKSSLETNNRNDADQMDDDHESAGKLVKPNKAQTKSNTASNVRSPHFKDSINNTDSVAAVKPDHESPDVYEVPSKPALSLSEYAFDTVKQDEQAIMPPAKSKPAKRPRNKTAGTDNSGNAVPAKRPRKRKAKSDSVILNSDEPEPDQAVALNAIGQGDNPTKIPSNAKAHAGTGTKIKPTKPTAKTAKASAVDLNEGVKRSKPDHIDRESTKSTRETSSYFSISASPSKAMDENAFGPSAVGVSKSFQHESTCFEEVAAPKATTNETIVSNELHPEESSETPLHLRTAIAVEQVGEIALTRRRDWTPIKDTSNIDFTSDRPQTAESGVPVISQTPRLHLTDILGNFGYTNDDSTNNDRIATGEAATKRRRIELNESLGVSMPKVLDESPVPEPKQSKRAKQPKKKPQTITALATAAFQPLKEIETGQDSVSEFFAHKIDDTSMPDPLPPQPKSGTAAKPKKPRKSRAKTAIDNPDAASKTKKVPKKAKVKFNEADFRPKLYSPDRASAQLKNQDFLFGTSSQLRVEESPQFVRDMQAAMRESELGTDMYAGSQLPPSSQMVRSQQQTDPRSKSCAQVPTAPHGTCLSVEQAERELWCVAARDFEGGVIKNESFGGVRAGDKQVEPRPGKAAKPMSVQGTEDDERQVVDLCHTSPIDANAYAFNCEPEMPKQELQGDNVTIEAQEADERSVDDSWMFLQSDSPKVAFEQRLPFHSSAPSTSRDGPANLTLPIRSPTSPILARSPLQRLDANISLFANSSPAKDSPIIQARPLSTTATGQARAQTATGRPVGRPRKDSDLAITAPPPKKRGRPPKIKKALIVSDSSSKLTKSNKATKKPSASQPVPQKEWIDIDEISDSDSPTTPSPPRRRATSSPPVVQPLQLSPSKSTTRRSKKTISASSTVIKPDGGQWPAMRLNLFPLITSAIKSVPRSTDPAKMSWWERILLYDPILVEDLTKWLNEQGLSVEVKKPKPKAKQSNKGKKRKAEDDEPERSDAVEEAWEIHDEPLQAWMVQKWCEEKGVCCYVKEGGWRGPRGRGY